MVIMILWRPTNNNQRYAFTPLLDSGDETEDDDVVIHDNLGNCLMFLFFTGSHPYHFLLSSIVYDACEKGMCPLERIIF